MCAIGLPDRMLIDLTSQSQFGNLGYTRHNIMLRDTGAGTSTLAHSTPGCTQREGRGGSLLVKWNNRIVELVSNNIT